jgi:Glycosyltransferase family 87
MEGILAYLKGKENKAIFLLLLAMFIKILPIFFLFWIFVRGNWKTMTKMVVLSSIFILIPLFWRGFAQGFQDHLNYYVAFLEPFQNGRVEPKLNNYSLAAMIFKWSLPFTNVDGTTFRFLYFDLAQANLIYKTCFVGLILTFFTMLWYSRRRFATPHFSEITFIFCLLHLLSGISWEYHFVSLFVVFIPLGLFLQEKNLPFSQKIIGYTMVFIAFLIGIDGQDTIGKTLHLLFNHYSVITILTILMLFFSFFQWLKMNKTSELE